MESPYLMGGMEVMMIQDIYPRIYHNEYHETVPADNDLVLVFRKDQVLLRYEDEKIRYPKKSELTGYPCAYTYLFSIDDAHYFLAICEEEITLEGYTYESIRIFRTAISRHNAFAGITAHHLFNWYNLNQYCGRCGHKMVPDHVERMLQCPACRNMVYPRISPAVIVGVLNGDKILMSKYAGRAYTNYALIAGFTEIGESVEQTVAREVMEEVGVHVKNIRYYKSQPWGFSDSLLLGFFCDLDGDDTIHLDHNELAEAGWYTRDEIHLSPDNLSLTREMIMHFKENQM